MQQLRADLGDSQPRASSRARSKRPNTIRLSDLLGNSNNQQQGNSLDDIFSDSNNNNNPSNLLGGIINVRRISSSSSSSSQNNNNDQDSSDLEEYLDFTDDDFDDDDDDDDDYDDDDEQGPTIHVIRPLNDASSNNRSNRGSSSSKQSQPDVSEELRQAMEEVADRNQKDVLRQSCISMLRQLTQQGILSPRQKRVLLTDIIYCSANGEFSMVEVAYELLCAEGEQDEAEIAQEEFAEQCRVLASSLERSGGHPATDARFDS